MTSPVSLKSPTIGVFDSGFGGLTVLRALLPLIPGANYLYLGDTARLPYGAKSRQTVIRYALSSARFLLDQGAELLVVACNTASALALPELQAALPIPVVGVIQPGTEAAQTAGSTRQADAKHILVLATAATVQSGAYSEACAALGLCAHEKACPLLVPLVEEGWIEHPVTAEVLRIYLSEALAEAPDAHTLLLGCTHYPLLGQAILRTLDQLGHPMRLIDSAAAAARAAASLIPSGPATHSVSTIFYATDSVEKFQRLGSHFLGRPLPLVHLIDLGG